MSHKPDNLLTGDRASLVFDVGAFAVGLVGLYVNVWLGIGASFVAIAVIIWLHRVEYVGIAKRQWSNALILPTLFIFILCLVSILSYNKFLDEQNDKRQLSRKLDRIYSGLPAPQKNRDFYRNNLRNFYRDGAFWQSLAETEPDTPENAVWERNYMFAWGMETMVWICKHMGVSAAQKFTSIPSEPFKFPGSFMHSDNLEHVQIQLANLSDLIERDTWDPIQPYIAPEDCDLDLPSATRRMDLAIASRLREESDMNARSSPQRAPLVRHDNSRVTPRASCAPGANCSRNQTGGNSVGTQIVPD